MVSWEQKKVGVHEKLQTLRSITQSHAGSKSTIIPETSKYMQVLKDEVGRLNQKITTSTCQTTSSLNHNHCKVKVERMEKGFLVKVYAERSLPELLVCVLEALEELNLDVIEARVSCIDSFRFQAIARQDEEEGENIDAQVVKQTLLQALNVCTQNVQNSEIQIS